jgi:hypothetical protein
MMTDPANFVEAVAVDAQHSASRMRLSDGISEEPFAGPGIDRSGQMLLRPAPESAALTAPKVAEHPAVSIYLCGHWRPELQSSAFFLLGDDPRIGSG